MPLESLLGLVETLKNRAQTHRDALTASEALTRYALIDPLLRELGWDTADPAMVAPEYRSGSGSADYALLNDGRPAMIVEAKKLGTPLQDSVVAQGINYCLMEGTKHFAVTDGARWDIYETHKPVPIDQKRVAEFDLLNQQPAEVCLKALALWRGSVQADYVASGHNPVTGTTNEVQPVVAPTPTNPPPTTQQTAITPTPRSWLPLNGVNPASFNRDSDKPKQIQFPNQSRADIASWAGFLVEAVRWMNREGLLDTSHCPIKASSRTTRYLVHTQPVHSTGRQFTSPRLIETSLYLEMDYTITDLIKNTIAIINHVGQDPAQFKVRFD